ncbi:PTS system, cellobiose-specific IIB component [Anaerobranca californiensis DSM 14826]|jgi:PTS system cellobiose-specific IIB component|uniref:PTS system, cellobiose-specific IIB component n=1 Tax=Anaerobranca californiensis DSM 14826 TaxID=1120989 RepID=A0A1M6QVT6_9FIRM|nr:PTS sugar transporter subunit IIB [Anaerobranca californiensis]SHK24233.1 PTS system, cellobiose-specific IIB component [Anaerobranca californiensis DSM 14826]
MKKILLACAAGMSTSLLVTKMQQAAKNKGIEIEITAVPVDAFADKVKDYHIALLGPQVRFKKDQFEKIAAQYGVKVLVINSVDYGLMKGEKILEETLKVLG